MIDRQCYQQSKGEPKTTFQEKDGGIAPVKKTYSLFAWIVAVAIALVLMPLLYAGSKYQITKANADRIKPGMTSQQVARILGHWSSIGFTMRDDSLPLVWTGCD